MNKLKIYCEDERCKPVRAHPTDAGLDLRADSDYLLQPGFVQKVYTGVHVEIPEGCVGLVFPRSGLATKQGITLANTVGVIDSDYRGEIICAVKSRLHQELHAYTRIAQLVIIPCFSGEGFDEYVEHLEDLSQTERGEGGFGHTGKR